MAIDAHKKQRFRLMKLVTLRSKILTVDDYSVEVETR